MESIEGQMNSKELVESWGSKKADDEDYSAPSAWITKNGARRRGSAPYGSRQNSAG